MDGQTVDKARLRRDTLALRDAMNEDVRIEASLSVADRLAAELSFDAGTVISGFLPIRSEIDIRPAMAALADRGARLCVPAIVGGALEFRHLVKGAPLEPQGFGTFAPAGEAAVLDPEIMLVPLSAFDRRCHRIGYGRGFYDRAIGALRDKGYTPRLVGVAFAIQEIEHVPNDETDVALDLVVTDTGVVRPS